MKRTTWLEHPQQVPEINSATILPTTIKGLKIIAADYLKKGIRPVWRTTYFQYLSVVARLLQTGQKYVLSDNTDVLIHEPNKPPAGTEFLIKHQYYRLIFQITPYASDALLILNLQIVTPEEVGAHIAEVVQVELKSQLHQQLLTNVSAQNQKQVQNSPKPKEQILCLIANRMKFTAKELQEEISLDIQIVLQTLQGLCQEGIIGDMGSYYIVNKEMIN